ncbi:MAG: TIGR02391 family protein [Ilumatobacter fluminis]|uniref:TIGR02391 family protein n=1 Tax=Ilumatobacter fluminis TaxID=467091 RepID=UPI0032EC4381
MDYPAAAEIVRQFGVLLDQNLQLWSDQGPTEARRVNRSRVYEQLPAVQAIAEQVLPGTALQHAQMSQRGWEFRHIRPAVSMVLGRLESQEALEAVLGPVGPQLSASGLHPWVWGAAASLWDGGHRREAVQAAATHVELQLRLKVGREDLSGPQLSDQAFSLDPPRDTNPRLRFVRFESGTDDYRSAHVGAAAFAKGCFLAIRNLTTHRLDPLLEAEALEFLAALSVFARWVDEAEVATSD